MAGYTRQSTFADGDTITAALFNNEYNQLLNAFSNTGGHKHDGTAAEGPVIGLIGDAGETAPNNKVLIDTTNNFIEFYVQVSSSSVQQLYIADGAIIPVTDSDIDLGTTSLRFKDTYTDTITTTGNVAVGGNLTVTGTTTFNGGTITMGDAATDNVVFGADVDSNIIPDDDDSYDLGSSSQQWKDIYIDGVAYVDAINFNGTAITSTAAELNILDGVTSTAAELNILDGVTSTAAEINLLDGVTSTTAELNILDGVTSTAAELNLLDGVTSTTAELNILDGVTASAADINLIDGITNGTVIASKAIITDANKDITGGRNITITGELDAATLDISGNADIDGTLETDALSINGTTVTSTAAELNILDGVTATAAEINALDGITSTVAELNILDGVTSTAAELNLLDGKAFLDEDDMSSNSATGIASQQSIKAYVDTQITAEDLDITTDSGTIAIDLDSETLTISGGTGLDSSATGNAVTLAIDSTVATLTGSQTLTNKSLTAPTLTGTAVVASLDISGDIDVDGTTNLDVVDIDGAVDMASTLNVSGAITGTLGTAAQPNITSLGTLTTLTVDDITINGSTISDGAALTLDAGSDLKLDADSSNIYLADGGTDIGLLSTNNQDLNIRNLITDKDIYFQGNDGGSTITALTLDMSNAGAATFNSSVSASGISQFADVNIPDNNAIRFGNGQDLQIYHDGTNSHIDNNTGNLTLDVAGDIILDADGGDVVLLDGGTEFGRFEQNSNNFRIKSSVSNADILLMGSDGGSAVTALTLDMSAAGAATFNTSVLLSGTGGLTTTGGNNLTVSGSAADHAGLIFATHAILPAEEGAEASPNVIDIGANGNEFKSLYLNTSIITDSDLTLDVGGDIILDADGADIRLKDAGTEWGRLVNNSSNFLLLSPVADKDIMFNGVDGSSEITALYLDMSDAGTAIFNHDIKLGDSGQAIFGADSDLSIYHDNSTGNIVNGTGVLNITNDDIRLKTSGAETMLRAIANGAVKLMYNNDTKLETTNGGVDIAGSITATSAAINGQLNVTGTTNSNNIVANQVTTQFDTSSFMRFHPAATTNSGGYTNIFFGTDTNNNFGVAMGGLRDGTSGEPAFTLRMLNDSITGSLALKINNAGGFVTTPSAGGHAVFNENGIDADFRVESDGNDHMLFVDGGNNRVGIGTSSPQELVHLKTGGTTALRVSGANNDNSKVEIGYDNTNGPYIKAGSSGVTGLQFYRDNTVLSAEIHRNTGDFYTNDGTISSLSDSRVKENIEDLVDGLEVVKQLKPKTFKYNKKSTFYDEKTKDIVRYGFIADEVQEVAPQYTQVGKGKIDGVEVNDLKSLSTTKMIPMLVKAIQEQQTQIEALQSEINLLKGE